MHWGERIVYRGQTYYARIYPDCVSLNCRG